MPQEIVQVPPVGSLAMIGVGHVPAFFAREGERGIRRYLEFFTANVRNANTREAYGQAVRRFAAWCEAHGLGLLELTPLHVAAYVEQLGQSLAKPSVKQHLAALRRLFDYLVVGQVVPHNPAASVRGPKYVIKKGKTPVLTREQTRLLFASIGVQTLAGLRDRALIGAMVYSFARVGAVLGMKVEDYVKQGEQAWLRLHEKGGKHHEVPVHHRLEKYLDAYVQAAGIREAKGTPLFRSLGRGGGESVTAAALDPSDALAMVKRRCKQAGLGERISCHSFRATGITLYLMNEGSLERAQILAAHESPRTTKLYDHTSDQLSHEEIEKILF